jgi:hypothetical protein
MGAELTERGRRTNPLRGMGARDEAVQVRARLKRAD